MTTRGDYSVVVNDTYYSCYQHTDMYRTGNVAMLLAEASDIAEHDDWDEVIAGWTAKAWVDEYQDDMRAGVSTSAAASLAATHPDGCVTPARCAYGLRPRISRDEMQIMYGDALQDRVDRVYEGGSPIWGQPSWRMAAIMPVMMKQYLGVASDLAYGVIVDADNREIVVISYPCSGGSATILGAASLDDVGALLDLADQMGGSDNTPRTAGRPGAVATKRTWVHEVGEGFVGLTDGQWRRPEGLAPLDGDTGAPQFLALADWPRTNTVVPRAGTVDRQRPDPDRVTTDG